MTPMSVDSTLPPNLRNALDSEAGYVIVITGLPGTGKSLFVQEIMRQYPNAFILVTDSENASNVNSRLNETIPDWENRHIEVHYWRENNIDINSQLTVKDILSTIYPESSAGLNSDMIIIDSWTDFVKAIKEADRYSIQQAFVSAARKEKKKIVLVTELDLDTNRGLSHSSDAIITLKKQRKENRMYRELIIEKLRALPLFQDTFLFTLDQGRFTYIPWYIHQYPAITIEREPLSDPSTESISTGNKSLDDLTGGGFKKAGLNLIEVDNLGAPYIETVYIPFLSNHLLLGRPAVIILPEGWSPNRFTNGLTHFVDISTVAKQVVFFGRHALGENVNVRDIDDDPWKTLQEIRYESDKLEREFNNDVTQLVAIDTLENKYGESTAKGLIAEISAGQPSNTRAIIAILSRQQSINSEALSPIQHLRVQEINGVLTICGMNPRTNFLVVKPILSKGYLDYELIPIV